jgi:hypothetical protein
MSPKLKISWGLGQRLILKKYFTWASTIFRLSQVNTSWESDQRRLNLNKLLIKGPYLGRMP